jgi:hypothetical protein
VQTKWNNVCLQNSLYEVQSLIGGRRRKRECIALCEMGFSEKTCLLEAAVVFNATYQDLKAKGHAVE